VAVGESKSAVIIVFIFALCLSYCQLLSQINVTVVNLLSNAINDSKEISFTETLFGVVKLCVFFKQCILILWYLFMLYCCTHRVWLTNALLTTLTLK